MSNKLNNVPSQSAVSDIREQVLSRRNKMTKLRMKRAELEAKMDALIAHVSRTEADAMNDDLQRDVSIAQDICFDAQDAELESLTNEIQRMNKKCIHLQEKIASDASSFWMMLLLDEHLQLP